MNIAESDIKSRIQTLIVDMSHTVTVEKYCSGRIRDCALLM